VDLNKVHSGDCLELLKNLPDGYADALVTDPPYCSGGDVEADPDEKYVQGGTKRRLPTFEGDNKSQHAFLYWCCLWLSECYRVCKPGAYAMTFTDARMLPTACDAFESGGFIRRGIIGWDKTEKSRSPHSGYFKLQMEFVVWGSKGPLPKHGLGPFPGCYRVPIRAEEKVHMTGKPVELMRQLLKPLAPGAIVIDPFAGGGSTIVACKELGLNGLGFEKSLEYTNIANGRLI
jgi:site-specific DNA-methyltransferase (adenine-specific)